MAAYSVSFSRINTDNVTIGTLIGGAALPRRCRIYHILIGNRATPADNAVTYHIQRITADGSGGTAVTPVKLDPASAASVAAARDAPVTTEPTYTLNEVALVISKNMRPTVQWVCSREGAEIVTPATAASGVGVRSVTPTPAAYIEQACIHFIEE